MSIPPEFNSAIVFDGSTIVHGVDIWKPWIEPPVIDSAMELKHVGNDEWHVILRNQIVRKYHTTDIRMSFVWFTECFYEEFEVKHHEEQKNNHTVHVVLEKFIADLRNKGVLKEDQEVPPPLDLAFIIVQNYIKYPIENHQSMIPFNYCFLSQSNPKTLVEKALSYLFSLVC